MYRTNKIDNILEGKSDSTYIICEIGINHNGDISQAIKLIHAAKDSGVDAVKFQKRDLPSIYSSDVLEDSNNSEWSFDYQFRFKRN